MLLRTTILSVLLLFSVGLFAQVKSETQLSEDARISIITCGPGEELYSAFGHSAIRVQDPAHGDIVFNYGTFSFNQPNFYLRFARGRLLYQLSVEPYSSFRDYYIATERSITEQVLNLNQKEIQRLYELLAENYQPENREYRYHFFYDNCSTRIRDIVEEALDQNVSFQYPDSAGNQSFRDMTDIYLERGNQHWGDYGIDLCLGLPTDNIASPYQEMFLPDYLMWHFDNGAVKNESGEKPLVLEKVIIYEANSEFPAPLVSPAQLNWGIFVLIFLFTLWRKQPLPFGWFDFTLYGLIGLLGIFFLLLWFATDHPDAKYNFNLLWALPTHFLLMPFYAKNLTFRKYYFGIAGLIGLVLLVMWPILPQQLHHACIPLTLLLSLRSYYLYRSVSIKTI